MVDLPDHISRSPPTIAVVIVGEVGIAHGAAIGDGLGKPLAERLGVHHIGPDRQQRAGDPRHQLAEMHIAGEHHVAGAHPRRSA